MDQKTAITEAINTVVEQRQSGEIVGFKQVIDLLKIMTPKLFSWSLPLFYRYQFYP